MSLKFTRTEGACLPSSQTSIISADFQRLSKVLKKILPLCSDNAHSAKSFLKRSPSKCISSCQQQMKLDQFSQQNTHCRTAFLQNSWLDAPQDVHTAKKLVCNNRSPHSEEKQEKLFGGAPSPLAIRGLILFFDKCVEIFKLIAY